MSIFTSCVSGRSKKAKVMYSTRDSMTQSHRTTDEDPNMTMWTEQFSTGDQEESNRNAFWNSGLKVCIKCGLRNMMSQEQRAGIRGNGETFGTDIFTCNTDGCGWKTSYQYDDSAEDCWHFEAMGWERGIMHYPVCYMVLWAEKHKLPSKLVQTIKDKEVTGDKLLDMIKDGSLEKSLDISKKHGGKVRKAVEDKYGAILT